MALPAGITTATVTVGVPVTFSGLPVRTNVTITPSAFLVHTVTGHPLVNMIEEATASDGVAVQFTLPHTDQDGFQDEAGNAYKNWYYTASIQYATDKSTKAPFTKVFQLAAGQTTVDLDLLPSGNAAMPYSAPLPTVSSVNGQTGAVTVAETSDEDVAAFVQGSGPTATALNATYMAVRSTAPDPAVIKAYIDVSTVLPTIKVWDGTAWIIASGGSGEAPPPPPAMRQLLSSAQQAHVTWLWSGSQTNGYGSWTRHVLEAAITNPVLFWRVRSDSTNTVGVTMRAAWRRVGTTAWTNLTFGGSATRVLVPTDDFSADPITGVFAANDAIEVLVHLTGDLGSTANPPATANSTASDGSEGCYVMTWATLAGGAAPTNTSNVWPTLRPAGVVAEVSLNSWALTGTSIGTQSKSLLDRAASNLGLASTNFAKGGESFANFPANFTTRYGTLLGNYNRAIVEHGANDTQSAVATIKANAIAYWNSLKNAGIQKIVQCTTTPFGTSTDGFATLENQTPVAAREPNRVALNQWERDGAPMISGVGAPTGTTDPTAIRVGQAGHPVDLIVDICAVVESSRDSGKWRVDLGPIAGDGLHPNATAHQLMGQKLADDITAAGLNT